MLKIQPIHHKRSKFVVHVQKRIWYHRRNWRSQTSLELLWETRIKRDCFFYYFGTAFKFEVMIGWACGLTGGGNFWQRLLEAATLNIKNTGWYHQEESYRNKLWNLDMDGIKPGSCPNQGISEFVFKKTLSCFSSVWYQKIRKGTM